MELNSIQYTTAVIFDALTNALRVIIYPTGLIRYLKNPFRKNSIFLTAARIFNQIIGFLFWILAAHLYTGKEVGLATAIISAGMLLAIFSRLGFDVGVVRYLAQEEDKTGMINSCYIITAGFSIILSLAFLLSLNLWSPSLSFLQKNALYAILFAILIGAINLRQLQIKVFTALRGLKFGFIQTIITSLRLILVVLLVKLGLLGIFSSWVIAMGIAFIVGNFFIQWVYPRYRPVPMIRKRTINDMLQFSLGNYVGESFRVLPRWILPVVIVNVLEPRMSAYFYVAWSLTALTSMISQSTAFSLLADISNDPKKIHKQIIRAIKFTFLLLIPSILAIIFLGNIFLQLFGQEYAKVGLRLLRLLAIAGIPVAFVTLYVAIYRIRTRVMAVVYIYLFIATFTIVISYALMSKMGLVGIGVAWLLANSLVAVGGIPVILKQIKSSEGTYKNRLRRS